MVRAKGSAVKWAVKQGISGNMKTILQTLASWYDNSDNGVVSPSLDYIATTNSIDRTTVSRNLTKLIDLGLIHRTSGASRSLKNSYSFDFTISITPKKRAKFKVDHQKEQDELHARLYKSVVEENTQPSSANNPTKGGKTAYNINTYKYNKEKDQDLTKDKSFEIDPILEVETVEIDQTTFLTKESGEMANTARHTPRELKPAFNRGISKARNNKQRPNNLKGKSTDDIISYHSEKNQSKDIETLREIYAGTKYTNGLIKELWIECLRSFYTLDDGVPKPSVLDITKFRKALKSDTENPVNLSNLITVLKEWHNFTKLCETKQGAFKCPAVPTMWFVSKYRGLINHYVSVGIYGGSPKVEKDEESTWGNANDSLEELLNG